jgi:hypothetical protein
MAVQLRCWNCDHDLPSPPFSRWQGRKPAGAEPAVITCRTCGWRYEVAWTAAGWRIVEAFRPGQAVPSRGLR